MSDAQRLGFLSWKNFHFLVTGKKAFLISFIDYTEFKYGWFECNVLANDAWHLLGKKYLQKLMKH